MPMALQALQSSGVGLRRILAHFPEDVSLAFAYGSAVYRQAGPNAHQENPMLDLVFTVDDPVAWHSKNLKKNWSHYSFLKLLGPRIISSIQNNYGAGVYFNPLIMCEGKLIKYGVIGTGVLIDDLLNWNNLYIAGRLQKPVKIVSMNENMVLRSAMDKNLKSAVTTACLMLPESFSEEDLFIEIAGLSYSDKSPEGQFTQLMTLPRTLQQQINHIMDPPGRNRDVEETLLQVAQDPDCGDVVRLGVSSIVRPSSISQSTKGLFTAGVKKSVIYSSRKLNKMWKGWLRKAS
ncbi:phosphatidate cytidylyltransferase, mitochondrial isoform X2 [Meriones unguiculatus]|uniref:phosphatidate cytidylyltransferase, mitochondrial isoform X2 n=1 Tax=Meriones unguiculatus TaxID=10047 RepID=UPI000B4E956D|nr:phosphatidate cytidylyltransferase, mitochondrial isoform X2 [Meriones unguiculatus]